MYAVVEFEGKEVALIPMIWLIEKSKSYWPGRKNHKSLSELVKNLTPPNAKWPIYPIERIWYTTENYDGAEKYLAKMIEESASSDAQTNSSSLCLKKTFAEQNVSQNQAEIESPFNIEADGPSNAKNASQHKSNDCSMAFESSDSSTDEEKQKKKGKRPSLKRKRYNFGEEPKNFSDTNIFGSTIGGMSCEEERPGSRSLHQSPSHNALLIERHEQALSSKSQNTHEVSATNPNFSSLNLSNRNTPWSSRENTPTTARSIIHQDKAISILIQMKAVQDQNSLKLDQILSTMASNTNINISRPDDTPTTPVNSKTEFKEMEKFLSVKNNFGYMRSRLAAIGGPTARVSSMNMMKFLMTNKLAMKFNWSGRDKKPFKNTKMMEVIYEAVKLSFSNRSQLDPVTDEHISQAVKDWLKLAKQRYVNAQKQFQQ